MHLLIKSSHSTVYPKKLLNITKNIRIKRGQIFFQLEIFFKFLLIYAKPKEDTLRSLHNRNYVETPSLIEIYEINASFYQNCVVSISPHIRSCTYCSVFKQISHTISHVFCTRYLKRIPPRSCLASLLITLYFIQRSTLMM